MIGSRITGEKRRVPTTDLVRQKSREAIRVPVLVCSDDAFTTRTRDISPDGIFVESGSSPRVGEEIEILLGHPGSGEAFPVRARVARVERGGFGAEFAPR